MKRHIDDELKAWKDDSNRKPLLLFGARQVGKTYAIRKFGAECFSSVAYLDFSKNSSLSALFAGSISPQDLVPTIEVALNIPITAGQTLLVFDEVQLCERALTSLKYFYEEVPELHVVAAGSLLGVKVNRDLYSFPVGKVDMKTLHPMDFEEFLWACGEERLASLISEWWDFTSEDVKAFPLHDHAMELVRTYCLVGGMPEAVGAYVDDSVHADQTRFDVVRGIQQDIEVAYIADMTKYSVSSEAPRIYEAWRSIPAQLAKENHKFQYSKVKSGGRASQYETAISWLESAGIVTRCTQVSDATAPLKAFENPSAFKLYMSDTGLLSAAYGALASDITPTEGRGAVFRGALSENYVLQQIVAHASIPYYWGVASKSEVEFVTRTKEGDIIPIEVKSGERVRSNSLAAYRDKYQPSRIVRMSGKNFGYFNGVLSVPLYAATAFARTLLF